MIKNILKLIDDSLILTDIRIMELLILNDSDMSIYEMSSILNLERSTIQKRTKILYDKGLVKKNEYFTGGGFLYKYYVDKKKLKTLITNKIKEVKKFIQEL